MRFLWYRIVKEEDGNYDTTREIVTYRFTRLPFGLTCSPFLLSATIRELTDMYKAEFPTAATLVDNSTFMDDFAAGAENDVRITSLYYELVNLMNQLRLPMAKWATNSEHLKEVWRTEGVEFNPSAWSNKHCSPCENFTCRGATSAARLLHCLTHSTISRQHREKM